MHKLDFEAQNSGEKLEMLACICNASRAHSEAAGGDGRAGQKLWCQPGHGVAKTRGCSHQVEG